MADPVENPPPPQAAVPLGARVLGGVGRFLITTGIVVLLFVLYQVWGTNFVEARSQNDLREEFDDTFAAVQNQLADIDRGTVPPAPAASPTSTAASAQPTPTTPAPAPAPLADTIDPAVLAYFFPADGDAVARIEIPAIGVDKIVVNGVQVADLRKGPGQYPGTATVGTEGNTSIAGHRTTYGAPFSRIDELRPGDEIHITGLLGRFTYRVMAPDVAFPDQLDTVDSTGEGHIIVRPGATWVLGDFADNRVTLTACHPKLSSRQRIIVAAELVEAPTAAPEFDAATIAAFTGNDLADPEIPGEALPADTTTTPIPTPPTPDLDEGLGGERDAIPGAIIWMLAATTIWVLAGIGGRRLSEERGRRIAVRLVGLVPAAACLWFSFEMIDRALPAG